MTCLDFALHIVGCHWWTSGWCCIVTGVCVLYSCMGCMVRSCSLAELYIVLSALLVVVQFMAPASESSCTGHIKWWMVLWWWWWWWWWCRFVGCGEQFHAAAACSWRSNSKRNKNQIGSTNKHQPNVDLCSHTFSYVLVCTGLKEISERWVVLNWVGYLNTRKRPISERWVVLN